MKLLPAAGLLLALFAVGGCKRAERRLVEERLEQATGAQRVEIDEEGRRTTIELEAEGGHALLELGEAAHIPADFPRAVPIYPGARVLASAASSDDGKRTQLVTLTAAAEPRVVFDYYKTALGKSMDVSEAGIQGLYILTAESKSGLEVTVTVTPNGDGTSSVQLMATPE
jgi:hypothetical protein